MSVTMKYTTGRVETGPNDVSCVVLAISKFLIYVEVIYVVIII